MPTVRMACALFLLALAIPLAAQYQTPEIDGIVNDGEYAHSSGNWSMTWDATYLYIAKSNLADSLNNALIVYVDIDPQSTPTAGTNSNGNTTGVTDYSNTPDFLAFRADARILGTLNDPAIGLKNGSGSWGADDTNGSYISQATLGTTRELRIRWEALSGSLTIPSSFRWFGYESTTGGTISDPMPAANTTIPTSVPYAYSIASTANGSSTDPFSVREQTVYVGSTTPSVLNSAIGTVNADTTSARRYIVFNTMSGTTIATSTDLTAITQTTTLDATTHPSYTSNPVLVLQGFSTNTSTDHGIRFSSCTGCVVRGFVLQNHGDGVQITSGSNNSVVGNYIGTNAAGDAASANSVGVAVTGCTSCTIGGTTAADRNVISGNSGTGVSASGTTSLTIQGNYIGTKANGLESLPNPVGVSLINAHSTLVGGTTSGGNVINTTVDTRIYTESSNDVSIYGNLLGVGANGTTALAGGNGVFAVGGQRLTIGATSPSTAHNTISHTEAAILTDISGGLSIRGNSMEDNDFAIDLAGSVAQPKPTVSDVYVLDNSLYLTFSLSSNVSTQSLQVDLYDADTTSGAASEGKTYRLSSQCYAGSSLTNQQWTVGSGFNSGDKIVLTATSFSDASCTTPGDGTSEFTSTITANTLAPAIFTGPGNFSDTSKWSGSALPIASQDFIILNSCTFDNGAPTRAYGDMQIGNGSTAGNLTWQSGNSVVLDVDDVSIGAVTSGTAIDMSSAGTLRVRGNMTVGSANFAGGTGTVEFTGTSKTVTSNSAIFHNITVTGSLAIGNQVYFDGTLNVQSGATFSGAAFTFLRALNGASITGSGTKSFGTVAVGATASVTASGNFSVSTAFGVDGTFTPTESAVITGTGLTFAPAGTIRVSRNGSNAITGQYVFQTIDVTNCTTEYVGTANQTISSRTFKNLTINNPVSVQLTGNLTITGVVNFAQGLAMGVSFDFILTNDSPSAVVQGTGWTRLTFRRAIATGTNTYLYPVGSTTQSEPVYVTFHNVTAGGTVRFFHVLSHAGNVGGNPGLDLGKDVSHIWFMRFESGTYDTYDITFNFGTDYDAGADPLKFVVRRQDVNTEVWSNVPGATPAATSISITGETYTPDHYYATGQADIDHYVVSASSSQSAGVPFTTTVTGQDVFNDTVNRSDIVVTMTSNTGNAQFDSDGNGTFGDNTKTVTNGSFTISTKDNLSESVAMTATDTNSKTGSSSSIDIMPKVFTGPGSFSDTSKWSGNALPNEGASFTILNACTFDSAAPVRSYGTMIVGDTLTSGNLSWQAGNAVVLDVADVSVTNGAGTAIDMTNGGSLRVRGNMTVGSADFIGGSGTVEFTGTSKTVTSNNAIFHNVTVTGSLSIGNQFYFNGALNVQTGATFSGSASTFLRPQNGASITGSGTKSFGTVLIGASAAVTASANFSVSTAFGVDGTFTPEESTVITGTGLTFAPTGTIIVSRNGTNAITGQYVFSTIDATNCTVEYKGTANQTISARTFKNLTINNPVTVQLTGNLTITGVVNFAQGLAMGVSFDFIVTNDSPSAVVQGTGWTRLTFRRAITTGTNTYLYPIGSATLSEPVNVTFHNVTAGGTVRFFHSLSNAGGVGGNAGIDLTKDVGHIWFMRVESGTFDSYDVTLNFGTDRDAGADPTKFVMRRQDVNSEVWSNVSPVTPGVTSITATGETYTPDHYYATGQAAIDHYVVSASSPQSAGAAFTTTVTAQDVFNLTANNSATVTMTS
ncbi:MAG TPA: hypothetical protein VJZ00_16860, partial [Thermoanaerobaculia bacterium]|nr:hypothetical protein [Thermoanaerobaculia bacterium]